MVIFLLFLCVLRLESADLENVVRDDASVCGVARTQRVGMHFGNLSKRFDEYLHKQGPSYAAAYQNIRDLVDSARQQVSVLEENFALEKAFMHQKCALMRRAAIQNMDDFTDSVSTDDLLSRVQLAQTQLYLACSNLFAQSARQTSFELAAFKDILKNDTDFAPDRTCEIVVRLLEQNDEGRHFCDERGCDSVVQGLLGALDPHTRKGVCELGVSIFSDGFECYLPALICNTEIVAASMIMALKERTMSGGDAAGQALMRNMFEHFLAGDLFVKQGTTDACVLKGLAVGVKWASLITGITVDALKDSGRLSHNPWIPEGVQPFLCQSRS